MLKKNPTSNSPVVSEMLGSVAGLFQCKSLNDRHSGRASAS